MTQMYADENQMEVEEENPKRSLHEHEDKLAVDWQGDHTSPA